MLGLVDIGNDTTAITVEASALVKNVLGKISLWIFLFPLKLHDLHSIQSL